MKKLIRSEKSKLIERAKSLTIALLFLSCVFLGYRILQLYKTQTNVDRALWGGISGGAEILENSSAEELAVVCNMPVPLAMTANSGSARKLLNPDSIIFNELSELTNCLIGELYLRRSDDITVATREEWKNALTSESLYIKYPLERYLNTDIAFYGLKSSAAQDKLKSISEIVIVYDDKNDDNGVTLFAADGNGDNRVKCRLLSDAVKEFKKKTKKFDAGDKLQVVFAWELNLDKDFQNGRAVLDPMLMVYPDEEGSELVSISIPRLYKSGLNFTNATDLTLGLVNAFSYNPNTIRQYVNSDNSIMFVGETGSLNLHPKGIIEYKALTPYDGVLLSGDEGLGDVCLRLGSMLEKLLRISGISTANADFKIKLTSVPQSYRYSERCELGFDYFAGDKRVEFLNSYGIMAVVQEGRLIELKMHIKDIKMQGEAETEQSLFEKIDVFCRQNPKNTEIRDAYGIYKYNEDGADITSEWRIKGAR